MVKEAEEAKMAEKKTKEKEADNERISVFTYGGVSIGEVTFRL